MGCTNCVVEKLCFSENTIFMVFSENTAVAIQNLYVEKNRKFMKNCGLFLNMVKCFWLVFLGFLVLWLVFCVFGNVAKVLKMFFPSFFEFLWGGLFLLIWVWKV